MDEKKDVMELNEERVNAEGTEKNKDAQAEKKERMKTIALMVIFVLIIVGGFASGCVQCTYCGDDNTRFFVYASGTSDEGIQYKSCVGPAGCLGFGINSKCWPTECTYIKNVSGSYGELTGCIKYYNTAGCIANSNVKSEGKYSGSITCLGISCWGNKYVETVAETTKAKEQNTCLGINCGSASSTESKNYNSTMPRQFTKGCWGSN